MRINRIFPGIISAGVVLAAGASGIARAASAGSALIDFDNLVGRYNLISLGNASLRSYGDTEGGIAIGGNLTIDGGTIAAHPEKTGQGASFASLYVAGNFNYNNTGGPVQMQSGHAALPGVGSGNQWDSVTKRLRHGGTLMLSQINSSDSLTATDPRSAALNPAWNFNAIGASARSISATLSNAPATGTISVIGQNLTFSAGAAPVHGVIVFDFDASLLVGNRYSGSMISSIKIDIPADVMFVINVLNANGRTLFGNGVNFNYADSYSRLLWNIEGAAGGTPATQIVTFGNGGQFYGSILAPDFTVKNANNTAINGQIIAGGFEFSGAELHFTGFGLPDGFGDEPLPPAPEPATYGIFGASALAGLALWRRRKSRAADTASTSENQV